MRKSTKITDFLNMDKEIESLPTGVYGSLTDLTEEKIRESMNALFNKPVTRTITLHTGTRGMYHFNWAIALEVGMVPESVERREVKLVGRLSQYTKEMVDEHGEIWAWKPAYGKIHWTRLKLRADIPKKKDPRESRFNQWEAAVSSILHPVWMSYAD